MGLQTLFLFLGFHKAQLWPRKASGQLLEYYGYIMSEFGVFLSGLCRVIPKIVSQYPKKKEKAHSYSSIMAMTRKCFIVILPGFITWVSFSQFYAISMVVFVWWRSLWLITPQRLCKIWLIYSPINLIYTYICTFAILKVLE